MPELPLREWLETALVSFGLSEEAEGYVLGRGLTEARVKEIGVVQWDSRVVVAPATDPAFTDKKKGHGPRGERLHGRLCFPIWSPRGHLLGVEARSWVGEKRVSQYLLPEAEWNPVFIGLTPAAMNRIWDGGEVWVVEGVYDMGAMEHVVPVTDVVLSTLRARVSPAHAEFLRRFCRGRVGMVYDNDETGRKQTHGYIDPATNKHRWGAVETLCRVGVRARDIPYRGGKDPGEIWERSGTEGLRRSFAEHL